MTDTPRDPAPSGAQAERTRLAWRRTALAMTVVGLLVGRMALHTGLTPDRAAGIVIACAVWLVALVVAQRRIATLARPQPAAMTRSAALTALCGIGFAAIGIALGVAELL